MRMAVTGRDGQVVRSLVERAAGTATEIITLARPEFDLTWGTGDIRAVLEAARPDVIVSAAAYTLVDRAESEPDVARAVNCEGPRAIAQAAAILGVPLIHLSTDYVFDGHSSAPYTENDPPNPMGVYGATKLAGEQAVLDSHTDSAVLRTAWVYSPFGSNFVKTMLRLAAERDEVSVVADQHGNPTSALDIADGILRVAANLRSDESFELRGVFHMAGQGDVSWADLAEAVFISADEAGGPTAHVRRIGSADYPTVAGRPLNSQLDCRKLERLHGVRLPDWRASSKEVVNRLVQRR